MESLSPALTLSRSRRLLERAAKVDATQAYSGYVLARDRLVEGEYPLYGKRASGAYVWDVDGNRYIDFILAYGTIIVGHADPIVSAAVCREIRDGFASRPLLERLHRDGFRLGLSTGNARAAAHWKVRRTRLAHLLHAAGADSVLTSLDGREAAATVHRVLDRHGRRTP